MSEFIDKTTAVLDIDDNNTKAQYRRGISLVSRGDYVYERADFKKLN